MPAGRQPDRNEAEARRALSRIAQEADGSAMAPAPERDPMGKPDWIEETGTRIGRVLGPVLLLASAGWLLFHLMHPG